MVQAIQVLRFHLLELEKVSIVLFVDKHIFAKKNIIANLSHDIDINKNLYSHFKNIACNEYMDSDIQIYMHFLDTSSIMCPRHTLA